MKIQVTQADISLGIRGSSCSCPIALATKRAIGRDVRVGYTGLYFPDNIDKEHPPTPSVNFPPSVTQFMLDFDNERPTKAFEFEIEVPK